MLINFLKELILVKRRKIERQKTKSNKFCKTLCTMTISRQNLKKKSQVNCKKNREFKTHSLFLKLQNHRQRNKHKITQIIKKSSIGGCSNHRAKKQLRTLR